MSLFVSRLHTAKQRTWVVLAGRVLEQSCAYAAQCAKAAIETMGLDGITRLCSSHDGPGQLKSAEHMGTMAVGVCFDNDIPEHDQHVCAPKEGNGPWYAFIGTLNVLLNEAQAVL